jgi:hypothetical protein
MYLNTYGGSALLHLLIGYPKLILLFGLAGTVAMTAAPHGPGRYAGTGAYMAQLDAALKPRLADAADEQHARQRAIEMLERFDGNEINNAVVHTLQQCGPGCTDLATPIVIQNPELLRHVLVLYHLDQSASSARATAASAEPSAASASARRE